MGKHTPGPWSIVSYLDEHDRRGRNVPVGHDVPGARHRVHAANLTVAYTVTHIEDARLMAASPAMRKALQAMLDSWDEMGCEHDIDDNTHEHCPGCAARAALALADGA